MGGAEAAAVEAEAAEAAAAEAEAAEVAAVEEAAAEVAAVAEVSIDRTLPPLAPRACAVVGVLYVS